MMQAAWMRTIEPLIYGLGLICLWHLASRLAPTARARILPNIARIAGWCWCLVAAGGGFGLLLLRGPWPPTNGWFALLSGLSACPLVGRFWPKDARLKLSGWPQFGAAVLLVALGRAALIVWPQPNPL